jgi:hypothetical protein
LRCKSRELDFKIVGFQDFKTRTRDERTRDNRQNILRSGFPFPRRRGIKGEDIQCENLSESGVLIAEGIKFQTDAYL